MVSPYRPTTLLRALDEGSSMSPVDFKKWSPVAIFEIFPVNLKIV